MATLNETPSGSRIHIGFFGQRNAGKSTLVNAFCGQNIAIVSDVPGTTTDPVSKAMEILPLGPCLITDTAGLDDVGTLGEMRVKKTLAVLAKTDIAVWVTGDGAQDGRAHSAEKRFRTACQNHGVTVIDYVRGESVEDLKKKIASVRLQDDMPSLLDGLVGPGDRVICVCPIDNSAPKGRLILPQVQVLRACLDLHVPCTMVQPAELRAELEQTHHAWVITDSQAFKIVSETLSSIPGTSSRFRLTSFSILFARQKGDIAAFRRGLAAIKTRADGDTVLIAEGCTHHRQCNDIGSVKIPKALEKLSGKKLKFVFASGNDFSIDAMDERGALPALIVHCGGCMLTRREVLRRIGLAEATQVPIVNYGMLLAAAAGASSLIDELPEVSRGLNVTPCSTSLQSA